METNLPFCSVVIPTRARARQLAACLAALARLDYPREKFEVVVVDDGGLTPPGVVEPFAERLDLTLLAQAHAGPATARNTGARRARGELLAFTDDDCAPDAGWLRALAARSAAAPGHAVGGRTANALQGNAYSTASQALVDYLYSYYNRAPGRAVFFTSNNLAVPRAQFFAAGGFDETFGLSAGEDREFCDRWRGLGHGMTYAPDAVVFHGHELTLGSFWRQHFNYGRGAAHFRRARARRGGGRVRVEPASFYLNLLRYPLAHAPGGRGLRLPALFAVSQLANAAGFFYERVTTSAQQGHGGTAQGAS